MTYSKKSPRIGALIGFIPVVLHITSAAILVVIAAAYLFEGIEITVSALNAGIITEVSTEIFGVFFHAATAIALLETIEVFFKNHSLAYEVLFLAGVSEVIRHILIYDLHSIPSGDLLTSGLLLGGLIGGVLITRHLHGTHGRNRKLRGKSQIKNQGLIQRISSSKWKALSGRNNGY